MSEERLDGDVRRGKVKLLMGKGGGGPDTMFSQPSQFGGEVQCGSLEETRMVKNGFISQIHHPQLHVSVSLVAHGIKFWLWINLSSCPASS